MISTALAAIASLLLPCLATFAANIWLDAAQDPVFAQATAAPFAAYLVRSSTSDAQGRLTQVPKKSIWRRLDENLKRCGSITFTTHNITTLPYGGVLVTAADLDGDGDLDILSAPRDYGGIVWYQNLDGAGNFSVQQREIGQDPLVISLAVADLDGDGDLDVLAASWYGAKITWYENVDGAGSFSSYRQHDIATWGDDRLSDACAVTTADLDGDGDLEVLSALRINDNMAYNGRTLSWYENVDGAGDFSGPQRVITTQADGARSIVAADLDGDADLDVLSSSWADGKIAWYENLDGTGSFSVPQSVFTANANGVFEVAAADLDGDGDFDILSTFLNGDIVWYENLDGAGDFSAPERVFATHAEEAYSVAAADLDGDGDLDVLSALTDSKIAWFENLDGAGNFSEPQRVITTQADGVLSAAAADLDGDADLDVLLASSYDSKIAWYENKCEPMTPQPSSEPTLQPTPKPTPEPTYWGAQVLGMQPQTVSFERICVAWCFIFGAISVVVLAYVVHASRHKNKNLARIILTIVLSQYDYGSDTLFIAFQSFVTPTLFAAAIVIYLLPIVVFIIVYRRAIGVHVAHIYISAKAKTIVHFDLWDDLPKALTEIGSFMLFTVAFAASTFVYLMLLFFFVSCKLMSISFFAVIFFETGGFECTQEAFEVMFKRNIFNELVFESSGELMIALLDTSLRAQQDFRSNTGLSSWAVLSIVGSSLMLVVEVWPYLYHIVWMGLGIDAGIAAVSTNIKFTPDEVLGTSLIDRIVRITGLFAPGGTAANDKSVKENSRCNSKVHDVGTFELAELREQ